jgi:hypothetical protein
MNKENEEAMSNVKNISSIGTSTVAAGTREISVKNINNEAYNQWQALFSGANFNGPVTINIQVNK